MAGAEEEESTEIKSEIEGPDHKRGVGLGNSKNFYHYYTGK